MRTYGLIGFPLEHSFSPGYFAEKFEKEGIRDAQFKSFAISSITEFSKLTGMHNGIYGLAVTVPYKQSIIPYLDTLDEEARAIGAVNCIRFQEGKTTGYNTDWKGFHDSLCPLLESQHVQALILGTGGSSKAVQFALSKLGIPFTLVSRNPVKEGWSYSRLDSKVIQDHRLIVNCTPVGMFPNLLDAPAIPYTFLGENHICFDLIYNPAETQFLKMAKAQGAIIQNGMGMLKIQAELNWKIWNSYPPVSRKK